MIYNWLPGPKAKRILDFFVDLSWLVFNIFLFYKGMDLCQSMASRNTLSSGMRLPLFYVYASLPIASFFLSLRLLYTLYTRLRSGTEPKEG